MASLSVVRFINGKLARDRVTVEGEGSIELPSNILALPGFVDMHVHLRGWEQSYKEDLESGSRAALAGGVIGVGDMPNTVPPIRSAETAVKRVTEARSLPIIYRLHGGVPAYLDELNNYLNAGIRSIKVYPEDLGSLNELAQRAAGLGMMLIIHCEDPAMFRPVDGSDISIHNLARPIDAELSCFLNAARLSLLHGVRIHFTHVTNPLVIRLINEMRHIGLSVDVTMHHVLLDYEECSKSVGDPFYCKVNPPLRGRHHRIELLRALIEGKIDAVASDHAPHALNEKYGRNYQETAPGFPGLETTGLLLIDLWRRGLIDIQQVISLYSHKPASILGIDTSNSLTLVDTKSVTVIDQSKFQSKARHSPFNGRSILGRIVATIIGGKLLMIDGEYESRFRQLIGDHTLIKP